MTKQAHIGFDAIATKPKRMRSQARHNSFYFAKSASRKVHSKGRSSSPCSDSQTTDACTGTQSHKPAAPARMQPKAVANFEQTIRQDVAQGTQKGDPGRSPIISHIYSVIILFLCDVSLCFKKLCAKHCSTSCTTDCIV